MKDMKRCFQEKKKKKSKEEKKKKKELFKSIKLYSHQTLFLYPILQTRAHTQSLSPTLKSKPFLSSFYE